MPTVYFRGKEIECREGATLRDVLLNADLSPHNGKADTFNCRGFGSCGTCAVKISGEISEPGIREKARLLTPPHHPNYGLRLSCQTKVMGDVTVEKYPGGWGTQIAEGPLPPIEDEAVDRVATNGDSEAELESTAEATTDETAGESETTEGDAAAESEPATDGAAADGSEAEESTDGDSKPSDSST